jgi:tRNA/rRNA methyltransferase
MAGTDRSRQSGGDGPVIVLVRPQLAQNIGSAARAMANFGLGEMRLVAPRQGVEDAGAVSFAAGAGHVLDGARVFPTLAEAIGDMNYVLVTTARERGQAKPVLAPDEGAAILRGRHGGGERTAIVFGPERTGLENDEIALGDAVLTFPVDPGFASLNLAQAVLLAAYEWMKSAARPLPFAMAQRHPVAEKGQLVAFFAHLEGALDRAGFFYPPGKKPRMSRNLRNIFHRMQLSEQDIRTLHGAVAALEEGPRGPSRRERRVLKVQGKKQPYNTARD